MTGTEPLPRAHAATPAGKPRARSLGIPFHGTPGPWNAITDVPGVQVGYATVIEGDSVRTGVTGIHPRGPAGAADPVAAGFFSLNGNGEMTGVSWIAESGTFSLPAAITNTHAVGIAHAGIVAWMAKHHPELGDEWSLPVAGETSDGYLNDALGHHVTEATVMEALEAARGGPVEEGSVGGGTGMICYEFKGGNGTASRRVDYRGISYTVGVFLQANFGTREELTLAGLPVGRLLAQRGTVPPEPRAAPPGPGAVPPGPGAVPPGPGAVPPGPGAVPPGAGSVIAIVATDAPLLPHQCSAMARRVTHGIARTGTISSHYSGDLFLAFSTANPGGFSGHHPAPDAGPGYDQLRFVPWARMNPFFAAVVQATEEAVANALVANEDMTGRDGHHVPALPRDRVAALFRDAPR